MRAFRRLFKYIKGAKNNIHPLMFNLSKLICAQETKEQEDWLIKLKLYYLHVQVQVLSKQQIFKSENFKEHILRFF